MWFVIGIAVILFFSKLDGILEALKSKDPIVQKEKVEKKKLEMEERYELILNLKENIGSVCTIKSKELIYVIEKFEITAKILDVDEDWIELEFMTKGFRKKTTVTHLILKLQILKVFQDY